MQAKVLRFVRDRRERGDGSERNERMGNRRAHSYEKRGSAMHRMGDTVSEWSGQMGESGTDRSIATGRRRQRW